MNDALAPTLGVDTRILLLAAGLMFLWALALGVQKYAQILKSAEGHAHPYTDIAHRAALLYSFALLMVATFVELSAWGATVNLIAAGVLFGYFAQAVAGYMVHGLRKDTANQFTPPVPAWMRMGMVTLIVAEIGAFGLLLVGFLIAQF
jgi:hypothetical protein